MDRFEFPNRLEFHDQLAVNQQIQAMVPDCMALVDNPHYSLALESNVAVTQLPA